VSVATTLVVVPARDEREHLAAVVDGIPAEVDADVVVLDGGGNGGRTWRRPGVEVVAVPPGNGRAVRAGLALAAARGHERVVRVDGDGQHDPAIVLRLLAALDDADVVLGTRFGPGADLARVPVDRLLLNLALRGLVGTLTGVHLDDVVTGCWGLRSAVVADLAATLTTDGYGATLELLLRAASAGAVVGQVPIEARYDVTPGMRAKYRPAALPERNLRAAEYFTVLSRIVAELGLEHGSEHGLDADRTAVRLRGGVRA
jgi:dolichol-phosphate mannosyltransferase